MIVVEIQDPEDGRVGHEVGPFETTEDAEGFRTWFLERHDYDADFVEVREVDRRLFDPRSSADVAEITDYYEGWAR